MLIDRKNLLLGLAVLSLCAVPVTPIFAQKTAAKTTASKKASSEDDVIRVPDEALKPHITKDDVNRLLKDYVNKFTEPDMPATLKQYKDSPEKYVCITKSRAQNNISALKSVLFISVKENQYSVDPDLLEVTGVDSSWFLTLYEVSRKVEAPAEAMDKALVAGSETAYVAALKAYNDAAKVLTAQLKAKQKKMDSAKLKALTESNRKRRSETYIKAYKKLVEEKAKELDRQQQELDKAHQKAAAESAKAKGK